MDLITSPQTGIVNCRISPPPLDGLGEGGTREEEGGGTREEEGLVWHLLLFFSHFSAAPPPLAGLWSWGALKGSIMQDQGGHIMRVCKGSPPPPSTQGWQGDHHLSG